MISTDYLDQLQNSEFQYEELVKYKPELISKIQNIVKECLNTSPESDESEYLENKVKQALKIEIPDEYLDQFQELIENIKNSIPASTISQKALNIDVCFACYKQYLLHGQKIDCISAQKIETTYMLLKDPKLKKYLFEGDFKEFLVTKKEAEVARIKQLFVELVTRRDSKGNDCASGLYIVLTLLKYDKDLKNKDQIDKLLKKCQDLMVYGGTKNGYNNNEYRIDDHDLELLDALLKKESRDPKDQKRYQQIPRGWKNYAKFIKNMLPEVNADEKGLQDDLNDHLLKGLVFCSDPASIEFWQSLVETLFADEADRDEFIKCSYEDQMLRLEYFLIMAVSSDQKEANGQYACTANVQKVALKNQITHKLRIQTEISNKAYELRQVRLDATLDSDSKESALRKLAYTPEQIGALKSLFAINQYVVDFVSKTGHNPYCALQICIIKRLMIDKFICKFEINKESCGESLKHFKEPFEKLMADEKWVRNFMFKLLN